MNATHSSTQPVSSSVKPEAVEQVELRELSPQDLQAVAGGPQVKNNGA